MPSRTHIFLCLLALSFTRILSTLEEHDSNLPTIHVLNALPKNSKPMKISCGNTNLGAKELNFGEKYEWKVKEKAAYGCSAMWGRFMNSWDAFDPKRDKDSGSVFWLVNKSGFFLRWDNSTWVKDSRWYTE